MMTRHASGCSILYGYHAAPARPYRTPGRSRMIPDNAEDYLVRAQEALNMHDMNARKEGIRQFIDAKTYKPGLGAYDKSRQAG